MQNWKVSRRAGGKVSKKTSRGVTLTEMMVVVLIIAVMLGMALPHFIGHGGRTSVKVAARDVASVMRLAHRKAATDRINYLAVFNLDNETIWVQSYASYTTSGANPDHGTEKELPDEVIITEVTAGTGGQPQVGSGIAYYKYSPKGTSQLGFVYLRDTDNKVQYRVKSFVSAQAKIYSCW